MLIPLLDKSKLNTIVLLIFLSTVGCDSSPNSWEYCVYSTCDEDCIDDGHQGGVCRDDNSCLCLEDEAECDLLNCNLTCWENSYLSGYCKEDECICEGELNDGTTCRPDLCDEQCLADKTIGGVCRDELCLCIDENSEEGGLSCGQALVCMFDAMYKENYIMGSIACRRRTNKEARQITTRMMNCIMWSECYEMESMTECLMENCEDDFMKCIGDYD
ncbi:MAG: hypothetical protein GY847_05445 [Proteobacteria bacterium]|nr:hypothetical protein [Pseudomonadota bacterium]